MTLLLTCATQQMALNMSDRRVTLVHADGTATTSEEPANKAVLHDGAVILTFTGLAVLDGEPTDLCIAFTSLLQLALTRLC